MDYLEKNEAAPIWRRRQAEKHLKKAFQYMSDNHAQFVSVQTLSDLTMQPAGEIRRILLELESCIIKVRFDDGSSSAFRIVRLEQEEL